MLGLLPQSKSYQLRQILRFSVWGLIKARSTHLNFDQFSCLLSLISTFQILCWLTSSFMFFHKKLLKWSYPNELVGQPWHLKRNLFLKHSLIRKFPICENVLWLLTWLDCFIFMPPSSLNVPPLGKMPCKIQHWTKWLDTINAQNYSLII